MRLFEIVRPPRAKLNAAFWRWFGSSKVVDRFGKPQVVFHGTPHHFDAFDPEAEPYNYESDRGKIFFTTNSASAQSYATSGAFGMPLKGPGRVIAAYISLQNPHIIDNADDPTAEWDDGGDWIGRDAMQGGHDGIIMRVSDGSNPLIIAFRSEQVKSVENRGTWDPTDPRIDH